MLNRFEFCVPQAREIEEAGLPDAAGAAAAAKSKRAEAVALLTRVRDGFMQERGAAHSDTLETIKLLRRVSDDSQ